MIAVELRYKQRLGHRPADATVVDAGKWRGIGEHAIGPHAVSPVAHAFLIERGHVEVKQQRLAGGDDVAAVAESLTMRAVRLDTDKVGNKCAAAHLLDAVEALVRTTE